MGRLRMVVVAGIMALLAACGGEGNAGAGSSPGSIGQGLSPGEFELEVDGYIRTQGVYVGGGEAAEFAPSNYGRSRERNDGSGGRQQVTATNAEGPYRLRFNLDLQRRDEEPDDSSVTIQLPPGARAGETYPLETALRARHGEAILAINGYGQVPGRCGSAGNILPGTTWRPRRGFTAPGESSPQSGYQWHHRAAAGPRSLVRQLPV